MVTRTDSIGSPRGAPFNLGEGRVDALANLQRELLEAYEQAGRAWLARVQSELERGHSSLRNCRRHALSRKRCRPIRNI
jgi:hypothetical protein